jgi:hypothetical protein
MYVYACTFTVHTYSAVYHLQYICIYSYSLVVCKLYIFSTDEYGINVYIYDIQYVVR